MQNRIQGKRIDGVLGNNELRDYLANKEETAAVEVVKSSQDLYQYQKPFTRPIQTLLIAPPITIPRNMQKRCIPPLGLSYIAASIEKAGLNVKMLDAMIEGYHHDEFNGNLMTYGLSMQQLEDRLRQMPVAPDVIGTSVLFSTDLHNLYNVAKVIKRVFPESIMIVGGLHPTIYPKEIFEIDEQINGKNRTVDFVIRGEGEVRFVEFIKLMQKGLIDRKGDGLVGYLNGEFFCNHQKGTIENIDSLPFPAYHLLPMEKYLSINIPFSPVPQGNRVAQILTSRGCPIGCSFCASTNMYKRYRHRSVENIMQEIFQLKERYDIDEIQFADDNLTLNREHSIQFFNELKKAGLKWCTPNGTMINTLTPDLLDLMAQSGLYQITLSVDSANAKTLKNLHHKPVNLNSIPGLIAKAKEYGIFTHGTLVVGMPGETIDDVKEGFDYVKSNLGFTSISTFIAAAIPGSELYHQSLDKGLITREEARMIDTTKNKIHLSEMNPEVLETMVMDFQAEFTEIAKNRDPEEYYRKYKKLIESGRLKGAYGGRLT